MFKNRIDKNLVRAGYTMYMWTLDKSESSLSIAAKM